LYGCFSGFEKIKKQEEEFQINVFTLEKLGEKKRFSP